MSCSVPVCKYVCKLKINVRIVIITLFYMIIFKHETHVTDIVYELFLFSLFFMGFAIDIHSAVYCILLLFIK